MSRDLARDERRVARVRSKGAVELRSSELATWGRIVDVSATGVRIAAEHAACVGDAVAADVYFDADPVTPFAITGVVARISAGEVALDLRDGAVALAAYIRDEMVAAAGHDEVPVIILVDPSAAARSPIAVAFRAFGWVVKEVSTPLEAFRLAIDERFDPSAIAIADSIPESVAEELRDFLAAEYPDAHEIAIGPSATDRDAEGRARPALRRRS